MRVSTTNFQNSFGKYLKKAIEGDEIIVTKNGRGVAKLIHYDDPMVYTVREQSPEYYIRKRVTYEEFLEITEHSESRFELIDGEIFLQAAPGHRHQMLVGKVFATMYQFFAGKECKPIVSPYDVKLFKDAECFEDDPNVVQPDVLVICDEDKVDEDDRYQGIPTLTVEVLSPTTRNKDLMKKLNLYLRSGIEEYWLIDPANEKTLQYIFEDRCIKEFITTPFDGTIESLCFKGLAVNLSQ